jgi:hypothetical protein
MEDVEFVKKTIEEAEDFHRHRKEDLWEKMFVLKNYDNIVEHRRLTSLATSVLLMQEKKKAKDSTKPIEILQSLLQISLPEGNNAVV